MTVSPIQQSPSLELRPVRVLPAEGEDAVVGEAEEAALLVVGQALIDHPVPPHLGLDGVHGLGPFAPVLGGGEVLAGEVGRGFAGAFTVRLAYNSVSHQLDVG